MSTSLAKVSLFFLSAIIFLLVILFQFSPFCIYKTDYAGGYVICVSTFKTIPQISSDRTDEVSGSHTSYNDQKNNLPPDIGEIDVVKLTVKNFSYVISNNQHVMVAFVAPWCYWSKKLAPEFAAAATELKGKVVLAKVNAHAEIELRKKWGIQGYPTIYFFVNGIHVDTYYHDRTRDAIANWIKTRQAGTVYTLMGTEEAENLLTAESTVALGFLGSLEIDPETRIPALVLLEKGSRNLIHFDGPFSRSTIADFISSNKFPSVVTYTWKNAPLIFNSPLKELWLFVQLRDSESRAVFKEGAKALKGKLLFVNAQTDSQSRRHSSEYFGISGDAPRVVHKKYVLKGELTTSSMKSFALSFLEDK